MNVEIKNNGIGGLQRPARSYLMQNTLSLYTIHHKHSYYYKISPAKKKKLSVLLSLHINKMCA